MLILVIMIIYVFSVTDSGGYDNLCGFNHPVIAVNRGIGSKV